MFETHLTIVGNVVTPVTRRRLPDNSVVANFRVASNERRYDRENQTWTDGDSLYVSVSCWRQLADNVHQAFFVGDPIIVRGRLRTRNYEDKDGKRQSVIEMDAHAVGPDLARATAKVTRLRRDGAAPGPSDGEAASAETATSDDPWSAVSRAEDEPTDDADPFRSVPLEAGVGA